MGGNETGAGSPAREQLAVVIGAAGGLGAALVRGLRRDPAWPRVLALSRRGPEAEADADAYADAAAPLARLTVGHLELTDPASIAAAARQASALGEVRLVIVATGLLHAPGVSPEKHWGAIDPQAMATLFAVNCTGPALVARHFLPLLPRRGRSVFAAISARVGSISDNRLGGWYGYRAAKAALNMTLKGLSIELARRAPEAVCIGLHPGTVDTALSRPFQGGVAPGRLFSPDDSAARLLAVIASASPERTGSVLAWDGSVVPP